MKQLHKALTLFLNWSCKMAGKPVSFAVAIAFLTLWFIIGIFNGFTATWLLVIDTIATINASLMVFIILNTQNRESRALHLKIDELIRVTEKAESELISIEQKEEYELEKIKEQIMRKKKM